MTAPSRIVAVKAALKAYRWQPSWRGTLLAALVIASCVALGHWQYRRAEQKIQLIHGWQAQLGQPALPASALPQGQSGQLFQLAGNFLPHRQFLLDNQVHLGRIGYEVYTPFRLAGGGHVLINRGWIAAPPRRTIRPDIALHPGAAPPSSRLLQARLYQRQGLPPVFGAAAEVESWPIRIQRADLALMATLAELQLVVHAELHLSAYQPDALQVRPLLTGLQPERHQAYALQWASFAVLALVLWLVLSIKRRCIQPPKPPP